MTEMFATNVSESGVFTLINSCKLWSVQTFGVILSGLGSIQNLSRVSSAEEIEKGTAVRHQLGG